MKANYDKKPLALEAKGNGSYFYRWDIEGAITSFEDENRVSYNCQEITLWLPITRDSIKKKVIEYLWGGDHEKKMINEFNSVQLGVVVGDEATEVTDKYKNFLKDRIAIKAMIDQDCDDFNIK